VVDDGCSSPDRGRRAAERPPGCVLWLATSAVVVAIVAGLVRGQRVSRGVSWTCLLGVADFRMRSEWRSLEYKSADYHRVAAARARRLLSEATTRWLKGQLAEVIARHEQIAAAIESACEPGRGAVSAQDETAAPSSETPRREPGGSPNPA
jgi:hypothetical protein